MAFSINFGDTSDYTRFEGGGSELLPNDGVYTAEIVKITEGESKTGNKTLNFTFVVRDEDASGKRVMKTQPVTGVRKDNKANVHGLIDILSSAWSAEGLDKAAVDAQIQQLSGGQMTSEQIIQNFKGKLCYIDCAARSYISQAGTNVWTSDVRNMKLKDDFEAAKSINAHRRPLPLAAQKFLDGDAPAVTTSATTAAPSVESAASIV